MISIIIPVFNKLAFTRKCLNCLFEQIRQPSVRDAFMNGKVKTPYGLTFETGVWFRLNNLARRKIGSQTNF
jgi:hypothetical protein